MAMEEIANRPDKKSPLSFAVTMLIALIMTGLLVMMGIWLQKSRMNTLKIGQAIPDFSLESYDGKTYQISELKGKVILVNFWSSWCEPCKAEAAYLEEVWQEKPEAGDVIFLGVNRMDTESAAHEFLTQYEVSFPNGADIGSNISRLFYVQSVPETFLIDKDGLLAGKKIGSFLSKDEINAFIEMAQE